MSDPAVQTLQPRLLQAQTSGSATATVGSAPGTTSDPVRPGLSQQQRASQKKAQVRAFPRAKKLEKLGVFSACKVMAKLASLVQNKAAVNDWSASLIALLAPVNMPKQNDYHYASIHLAS